MSKTFNIDGERIKTAEARIGIDENNELVAIIAPEDMDWFGDAIKEAGKLPALTSLIRAGFELAKEVEE